jgi:hypothetical protein
VSGDDILSEPERKESLKKFKGQINLNELREIYNEVRNVSSESLQERKLYSLRRLKTIFEEIEKENQEKIEKGSKEASKFAELDSSMLGKRTRKEMDLYHTPFKPQPIEPQPPLKRQKTSENWWESLASKAVNVSTTFLGNFGINLPQPEIKEQEVKVDSAPPQVARFMGSSSSKENAPPPSSKKQDRSYFFINSLECEEQLNSSEFLFNPNDYLKRRITLWNGVCKDCGLESDDVKKYMGEVEYVDKHEQAIIKYIDYLKQNISKISEKKASSNQLILLGFLQIELSKVDHMVRGSNLEDRSFSSTRGETSKSYGVMGLIHSGSSKESGQRKYDSQKQRVGRDQDGNEVYQTTYSVPAHLSSVVQKEEWSGKGEVDKSAERVRKRQMFNEISDKAQEAIINAINRVENKGERAEFYFAENIVLPEALNMSQNFKFQVASLIPKKSKNQQKKVDQSPPKTPPMTQTPASNPPEKLSPGDAKFSPVPEPFGLNEEDLIKSRLSNFNRYNLHRIVDEPLVLSPDTQNFKIRDRIRNIDVAIGYRETINEGGLTFKLDNPLCEDGYNYTDKGQNLYRYIRFLDERVSLLNGIEVDFKSSYRATYGAEYNSSEDVAKLTGISDQIKKQREEHEKITNLEIMRANLSLELLRINAELTPSNTGESHFKDNAGRTHRDQSRFNKTQDLLKKEQAEKFLGQDLLKHLNDDRIKFQHNLIDKSELEKRKNSLWNKTGFSENVLKSDLEKMLEKIKPKIQVDNKNTSAKNNNSNNPSNIFRSPSLGEVLWSSLFHFP